MKRASKPRTPEEWADVIYKDWRADRSLFPEGTWPGTLRIAKACREYAKLVLRRERRRVARARAAKDGAK